MRIIEIPESIEWHIPEVDDHTSKVEIKIDGHLHLVSKSVAKLLAAYEDKLRMRKIEIEHLEKALRLSSK